MGLRRGLYIVEVECPGFEIGSSSVEVPGFLGPDQVRVNVRLGDRISDDSLPPKRESSTVSVRELSVSKEASSLLKGAEKEDSKDNPEKATELLKKALEIDPEIYQAYNNLAVQYVRLGLIGEAVQMLLRSIGLYPDDSTTFRNLAELLILQGALDEALMALERSQDLDPGHPKGLMLFGEVYLRYEQYELALDYFERASEVSDETHSFLGMGQCYAVLGRLTEALREFKRFVEEHPEDHRIEATHQVIAQLERDLKIDSP
jgi:tetratricopeptide (TPR) repeat protein